MNTYLRAFTADQLITATITLKAAAEKYPESDLQVGCANRVETPVNGEKLAMPIVCSSWEERRAALELKRGGVKAEADRAAYLQGAIATLAALGLLTQERINQITYLGSCGRLDTYMELWAESDVSV